VPAKPLGPSRRSATVHLDAQADAFRLMTEDLRRNDDFKVLRCVTPTGRWMHVSEVIGSKWVSKELSQHFLDYLKTGQRALRDMRSQFPQFMGDQLVDAALLEVVSKFFGQSFRVEQPERYETPQLLMTVGETTLVLGDWAGWRARTAPRQAKAA
jgi:hypothetical protein